MKPVDKMTKAHGSAKQALLACIEAGMNTKQIAEEYGCHRTFISQLAKAHDVVIPVTAESLSRKHVKKKEDTAMMGVSTMESRKAMTAACLRGEELSRARIMEQVATYQRDHPLFEDVCADIMRQRETCRPQRDFTELLWKE